jgi:hypothetical protein
MDSNRRIIWLILGFKSGMYCILLRSLHPQNYTVLNQATYRIHASECWIHIQLLQLMLIDISPLCEGTNDVTPSETFIPLPVVWMETFQARQTVFSCHKAEYTLRKLHAQHCYCSARVLSNISRRSYMVNVVWRYVYWCWEMLRTAIKTLH